MEVGGEIILSPEIRDGQNGLVACPDGGQVALRCDDGTVTETLRSADCDADAPAGGDCEPGAVYVQVEGSPVASPKILEGESHAYSCPSGGQIIFECKEGNVVEKFRTTDCSVKRVVMVKDVSATLMYGLSGAFLLFRIRI